MLPNSDRARAGARLLSTRPFLPLAALMGAVALAVPSGAGAAEFYIGGTLGRADADGSGASLAAQLDARGWDVDTAAVQVGDTGWRAYAGIRFTRYFAVEFARLDMGAVQTWVDATVDPADTEAFLADVAALTPVMPVGYTLGGVAALPMTLLVPSASEDGLLARTSLRVKLGLVDLDSPIDTNLGRAGRLTDTEMYVGIGGGFALTQRVSLIVEWERFDLQEAVNFWSGSVQFNFR